MASKQQGGEYPVVANVPRKGDEQAVIPYMAIGDNRGNEAMVAGFGELVIGQRLPDILITWNYDINPERATETYTGVGTAGIDTSRLYVAVEGGAGTAEVASKRFIVYRAGYSAQAMFTAAFDTPAPGTTQKCGAIDDTNGYYLSLANDNQLQVNFESTSRGVTTINQFAFNVDTLDGKGPSRFTLNPQGMNIYRICYGYLGKLHATFEVYGGSLIGWVMFHAVDTIDIDGGGDNLLAIEDPNLAIRFQASSDGTANVRIYSGSWNGGIVGGFHDRSLNDHFSFDVTATIAVTTETFIGAMRVKSTYAGKVNKLTVDMHNITGGVDGTKPVIIRVYKNTTLTGGTWNDVIGPSSLIEVNTTATAPALLVSERRHAQALGKTDSFDHSFDDGELRLSAGDTLTFTGQSANNFDVTLAGDWDELK